jgi:hypothetical protein
MDPNQPIEFVETSALLEELKKRFDSMFFIGYRNSTKTRDDYQCAATGPLHEALGLLHMAMNIVEEVHDGD